MTKQTKKEKLDARRLRLMARLTLLHAEVPTTEYKRKMVAQERANIIRQLEKCKMMVEY